MGSDCPLQALESGSIAAIIGPRTPKVHGASGSPVQPEALSAEMGI